MRYQTEIIPYSKIWFNCNENMILSMLSSCDEFYLNCVINNRYVYIGDSEISKGGKKFFLLHNNRLCKFESFINLRRENIEFSSEKQLFEKIEKELIKGSKLIVGVDLYYWIPGSICWGKHHWFHYSMITGYDSEKKVIYVMDDNKSGYYQFEIPMDRFVKAVYNSEYEMKEKLKKVSYNIQEDKPKFKIRNMLDNCDKIVESIDDFNKSVYWEMTEFDYKIQYHLDLNMLYFNQIINQHLANERLLQRLYELGVLNQDKYIQCVHNCKRLILKWRKMSIELGRLYFNNKKRRSSIERINRDLWDAFYIEKKMWKDIKKSVSCKGDDVLDIDLYISRDNMK